MKMKAKKLRNSMFLFVVVMLLMLGACGAQGLSDELPVGDGDGSGMAADVSTTTTTAATTIITTTTTTTTTDVTDFPQLENLSVGDHFFFGSYEQDNDLSNGAEPIEWRVLEVRNDRSALVISEYALDCVPYNESWTSVTWETCTLRNWLNNDFYTSAFSYDEQQRVIETTLSNPDNPDWGTKGGTDTCDKVFCLSIDDAKQYFSGDADRKCEPTAYARANGETYSGNFWWLRSPFFDGTYTAYVVAPGNILNDGGYVVSAVGCVRPAVIIRLSD